jgi:hypothetical protein
MDVQSVGMNSRSVFAILVALVFGMMVSELARGTTVTLGWNASVGSAGYNLYFGGVSQNYTNMINVGNATTGTVTGLSGGITYYFSVTAYDVAGLESPFSSEVSYTIPATNSVTQTNNVPPTNPGPVGKGHKAKLQLSVNASKQPTLTATAPAGYVYNVQASIDLKTWTTIGRATASSSGTISYTDKKAKNNKGRYYRLQQTYP